MSTARVQTVLLSALLLLAFTSPGGAMVHLATTTVATLPIPKACSGAFRYAARVGNTDIVEVSPVQAFARDRRLTRTRYSARGMYADATVSRLLTAMCGSR